MTGAHMRLPNYGEWLALGFVGCGCLLGAVLGWLWAMVAARGERRG